MSGIVRKKSLKPLQFTTAYLPILKDQSKNLKDLRSRTLKLMPKHIKKVGSISSMHNLSMVESPVKKKAEMRRSNQSLTSNPLNFSFHAKPHWTEQLSIGKLEEEFSKEIKNLQDTADFEYFTKMFQITSLVLQKVIDINSAYSRILTQVKRNYETYHSLIVSHMEEHVKELEYRENLYKNALSTLNSEGVPVDDICLVKIPQWSSLFSERKVPALKVPQQNDTNGFHQEFMSNMPEFSESWRDLARNQGKLAKYHDN